MVILILADIRNRFIFMMVLLRILIDFVHKNTALEMFLLLPKKKNDHKFETHGSSTDTQWMIMEILYFIGFTALAQHIVLYTSNAKGNC